MSMRSQVYEWDAGRGTTPVQRAQAGQRISIFIGGFGNNITKPAETTATEFVVIEDIAVTPTLAIGLNTGQTALTVRGLQYDEAGSGVAGPRAYTQVRINTTDYFLNPDNVPNDGIPDVIVTFYDASGLLDTAGAVLSAGDVNIATNQLQCFVKYTLYDGPDALIANKLLEMGISINPGNVDWYKRSLLASQ